MLRTITGDEQSRIKKKKNRRYSPLRQRVRDLRQQWSYILRLLRPGELGAVSVVVVAAAAGAKIADFVGTAVAAGWNQLLLNGPGTGAVSREDSYYFGSVRRQFVASASC